MCEKANTITEKLQKMFFKNEEYIEPIKWTVLPLKYELDETNEKYYHPKNDALYIEFRLIIFLCKGRVSPPVTQSTRHGTF